MGESADVDTKLFLFRDIRKQSGVKTVDSFDNQHVAIDESERIFRGPPCFGGEVETGGYDRTACEELAEVMVQERKIQCFDVLEIGGAVEAGGDLLAVILEVVIHFEDVRVEPADAKVNGESFRKGGFAGGGGAGNEHDAGASVCDVVGNGSSLALVEGFGDFDEFAGASGEREGIETSDRIESEDTSPLLMLFENLEEMGHLFKGGGFGEEMIGIGKLEDEAGGVGEEAEEAEMAGGGQERSLGQSGVMSAECDADAGSVVGFQQFDGIARSHFTEQSDGLHIGHGSGDDGNICGYVLPHSGFDLG